MLAEPRPVSISAFYLRLLFTLRAHMTDFFSWGTMGKYKVALWSMQRTHSEVIHSCWVLLYCVVGSSRTVGMTRVAALTCPVWRRTCGLFNFVPIPRTRAEYRQRMKDETGGGGVRSIQTVAN